LPKLAILRKVVDFVKAQKNIWQIVCKKKLGMATMLQKYFKWRISLGLT
jgi:hypothetical protein